MPYPRDLRPLPGAPGHFALRVDPDHPAFDGHFPGDPILSGLIQVDWAIRLSREAFDFTNTFRALEHLKFQAPIRPAEPVELRLSWDAPRGCLDFVYWGQEGRKSQGIAVFATAP
jgi:3-hydroxymyristoyl/3-hydroxydecanoyl-(acyl carrier protein) dehydratase